jgi:DNA helicase II / ATP-dependent DNA helicase PcrA
MVGDHRQATYTTNDARKNKRYARAKIVGKFEEWQSLSLCAVEYRTESHRCVQSICDFADLLYPNFPKTRSLNEVKTGHDGSLEFALAMSVTIVRASIRSRSAITAPLRWLENR